MVLIILAALLLLAILFFQAIQGLFSAMITAILTILSAVVALNYFEPMAEAMLGWGRLDAYALSLSLLALTVIPLIVLRLLFDRIIPGNVVLGMWADRAGGAVFGAVTAFVLVGIASLVIQLLPFPGAIFGYAPYKASLKPDQSGPPMWASNFTLSLAKGLSSGSLSPVGEGRQFGSTHRDLAREAFCLRSRPPGGRMAAPIDAMKVTEAFRVTPPKPPAQAPPDAATARVVEVEARGRQMLLAETPHYPLLAPTADHEVMVLRVKVSDQARDTDDWWRLPAGHFKLITADGRDFYPVGYLTFCGRWRLETVGESGMADVAKIAVERPWDNGPGELTVDWVYSLPAGVRPAAMAFRMAARSDLPPMIEGLPRPEVPKTGELVALGVAPAERSVEFKSVPSDRLLQPKRMERDDKMPREMTLRVTETDNPVGAEEIELDETRRMLRKIRFSGPIANLIVDPRGTPILKFALPKDHSVIMVHCEVNPGGADVVRDLANAARPELVLDNRQTIPACGAFLTYESGGARHAVYAFDADASRPGGQPAKLDATLAQAWQEHLADVKGLVFIFAVGPDSDRAAAGLKLTDDPRQEYYPPQPVALRAG